MSAVTVFCSPSRYTQGKNATAALGAEMTGLALAEQRRDVQAPLEMAGLMRDVREMMNSPLESYRTFIDDLVATGVLSANRRDGLDEAAWAAVHGLAVLFLDGPLAGADADHKQLITDRLLDLMQSGIH